MIRSLLATVFLLFKLYAWGYGYYPAIGAQANALGGCGLLLQNTFSASNNPALIPWQKNSSVGFSYNNQFLLSDVNQSNLCIVLPYKHFGYGFKLSSFGNNVLKDQLIGANVAHAFHPDISLGAGINYHLFAIRNYGADQATTFEFSLAAKVSDKLKSCFMVFNPFAGKFNEINDERMTRTFRFGINYTLNDKVFIVSEIEKNHIYQPNFKVGVNYEYSKLFSIRFGASILQPNASFGFGFKTKKLIIETAHIYHLTLGLSNYLNFIYHFGQKS
jgi:hypothetical protein